MKIAIIDDVEHDALIIKNLFLELGYHDLTLFFGYYDAHGKFDHHHFDLILLC